MSDQNSERISRLLPGLTTEYTIVSMPAWAWPWLDTLVEEYFPLGYQAFIRECAPFASEQYPLAELLENVARIHREDHYRLTNDNWLQDGADAPVSLPRRQKPYRYARAMKLFGFVPFVTDWQSALVRKGWRSTPPASY